MHFIGILFGGDESLLENYYEGLEVDQYIRYTKEEIINEYIEGRKNAIAWRKKSIKENSPYKSELQQWINENPRLTKRTAWKLIRQHYNGQLDEHGNVLSEYNPNSKWDWYTIGGRWSGYFPLKERDENGNVLWVDEATILDIDWELYQNTRKVPYCYITEGGNWEEREGVWFKECTDLEEQTWYNQFYKELKSYPLDTTIKAIDFHI